MKRTILVVDDDETIRKTMSKVLGAVGYKVETASNGQEALDFLDREEIKVFLLDLMMPGIDGLELCRQIKKKIGQECVIYALTGHIAEYDIEKCREAGFDDYFVKPFKIDLIIRIMAAAFEKVERWQKLDRAR